MFINAGARNLLMQGERQKFIAEEWPRVYATMQRLGLSLAELPKPKPPREKPPKNLAGESRSSSHRPSNSAEEEQNP